MNTSLFLYYYYYYYYFYLHTQPKAFLFLLSQREKTNSVDFIHSSGWPAHSVRCLLLPPTSANTLYALVYTSKYIYIYVYIYMNCLFILQARHKTEYGIKLKMVWILSQMALAPVISKCWKSGHHTEQLIFKPPVNCKNLKVFAYTHPKIRIEKKITLLINTVFEPCYRNWAVH